MNNVRIRKMKAAVFKGNGVLSLEDVPIPQIVYSSDVLVKVEAAGICGSDLHLLDMPPGQKGEPGTVLGHEFVATVVKTGSEVSHVAPGDRVIVEPNICCGVCPECRSGREGICRNAQKIGQDRNGGFSEYCVVPARQLYSVPDEIPDQKAVLIEPLACVMSGMMAVNPMPHEKVLIFGAGAIGLIFLKVMFLFGVRDIIICDPDPERRRIAEKMGADIVLDPSVVNASSIVRNRWNNMADISIDAAGAGSVLKDAMDSMNSGGRILVFSQDSTQRSNIRPADINIRELNIFATRSTRFSFSPAIEICKNPGLELEEIVTHRLPLTRIGEGMELMRSQEAVKVIITPD